MSQDAHPVAVAATASLEQPSAWRKPVLSKNWAAEQRPQQRDPLLLKWDAIWNEFMSQHGEAREAVFLRTLDDPELMSDDAAFEMLSVLHDDAAAQGERERFARMVQILAERRPEVYQESADSYISWQLMDALAEGRSDVLGLTEALAGKAGRHIDSLNRCLAALAYHGQLVPIVDATRIGWPLVRHSDDIMDWAINEFAEAGVSYEIYAYLEATACPDPANGALLERIRYFIEEPRLSYVAEHILDLSGTADDPWTLADFTLNPPTKQNRHGGWDDEDDDEEDESPEDPGSHNLFRLIAQFVGYLRRVMQVPYPRGELIRDALHAYFIERHQGKLKPRLSMLDQAVSPKKKLPTPRPSHPLCPERVTFEVYLAQMFGFMSAQYHKAAALFEVIPAWLRFLHSKNLITDEQRARALEELRPLHADLLKAFESYTEDPTLLRSLKGWPGVA